MNFGRRGDESLRSADSRNVQDEFLDLLEPLLPSLNRFCSATCRVSGRLDNEKARDLASETILKAFESFPKLRDRQAFQSYLFTIAIRIHRHDSRKQSRWLPLLDKHRTTMQAPDDGMDERADVAALYVALDRLPWPQKQALILSEILGMKLEEVANVQSCSLSAVKSRVSRGRRRLAEILGVSAVPVIESSMQHVPTGSTASLRPNTLHRTQFAYMAKEKP